MSSPIEVSPPDLHRAADGLRATARKLAGDPVDDGCADPGWAVTEALADVVAAIGAALRTCEEDARTAADRLDLAADGYERADRAAADRLRW